MANGGWGGFLTIVPADEVTAKVDAECQNYPRLEDAWEGLKWLLARSALTIGRPYRDDQSLRLYVQADDLIAQVPSLWVLYRVGAEVEILDINIVPPSPVEDEE